MSEKSARNMDALIRRDGRYPREAFEFLHEGFEFAVKRVHGEGPEPAGSKHVSGGDLCLALRDLAVQKWGLLAPTVLEKWNIHATLDFGNMVYLLVNNDFMRKTEEDSLEDFQGVFDFKDAFNIVCDLELKE